MHVLLTTRQDVSIWKMRELTNVYFCIIVIKVVAHVKIGFLELREEIYYMNSINCVYLIRVITCNSQTQSLNVRQICRTRSKLNARHCLPVYLSFWWNYLFCSLNPFWRTDFTFTIKVLFKRTGHLTKRPTSYQCITWPLATYPG